ncbi:MAG TPA: hypothetical protein VF175_13250, partial [Lacipirellula sp.]
QSKGGAAQRQNFGNQSGAGQAGSATLDDVKGAARQTGEQLKDSAQSAADALREQGEGFFQEQKGKAAGELTTLSSAIRGAADRLRSDDESHAARYAEMAADKLDGAARFLGEQDLGSLAREVERAARRRPELFLGGMFLVGLGISRFLKASRNEPDHNRQFQTQGSP